MKWLTLILSVIFLVALQATTTSGQVLKTSASTKQIVSNLEKNTDQFASSVDTALDRSIHDDSRLEDQFNALVDEFEVATDDLKDQIDDDIVIAPDVRDVLRRGLSINRLMEIHKLTTTAQSNWKQVKGNLDELAKAYSISWVWAPSTDTTLNRASTRRVINRLEEAADDFRDSFDATLDRSRIDGTEYEDFMNKVVATFENTLDKLDDQSNQAGNLDTADLNVVIDNAKAIDDFLRKHKASARTLRDWNRVKVNLYDLATLNNLNWDWSTWKIIADGKLPVVR